MPGSRNDVVYSRTSTLVAPASRYGSGASTSSKRVLDSTTQIPTPGVDRPAPKRYEPPQFNLVFLFGTPLVLMLLGIALEIATNFSTKEGGFRVPTINVFGTVSGQFLASIIPTLIIIPYAVMYRLLDWSIRWFQPYIVLQKGNASAEESLLLDYVELGPFLALFRAVKYKHRIVFWSSFTALITYGFQPLAGSIFQIRQTSQTDYQNATSTEALGMALDIQQLNGFLAASGYVEAATLHGLGDPPFVFLTWATAEFLFPKEPGLNGSLTVNTTAISTNVNCANPKNIGVTTISPTQSNISAVSVDGCAGNVSFNQTSATQQYGVINIPCGDPPETDPNFQSVMFWYFHTRDDGQPEAKAVFCSPTIQPFYVTAVAHLDDGRLDSCNRTVAFNDPNNNVTGTDARFQGKAFNGLFFNDTQDPFIQARASAIRSGVPGTVFRKALSQPAGLQAVFDLPNGMMDLTSQIYTQHLAVSARSIYFMKQNQTLNAELTSLVPRLWIDPLPGHFFAFFLFFIGFIGIFIHIINRSQRKKLILAAPPGSIASIVALTAHSGFGDTLWPYDDEKTLEKKLDGIKFRLDERTGAIVADEVSSEDVPGMGRDSAMLSLLGKHNEKISQHSSSSQMAYQAAVGYPPWVYKDPYVRIPESEEHR